MTRTPARMTRTNVACWSEAGNGLRRRAAPPTPRDLGRADRCRRGAEGSRHSRPVPVGGTHRQRGRMAPGTRSMAPRPPRRVPHHARSGRLVDRSACRTPVLWPTGSLVPWDRGVASGWSVGNLASWRSSSRTTSRSSGLLASASAGHGTSTRGPTRCGGRGGRRLRRRSWTLRNVDPSTTSSPPGAGVPAWTDHRGGVLRRLSARARHRPPGPAGDRAGGGRRWR